MKAHPSEGDDKFPFTLNMYVVNRVKSQSEIRIIRKAQQDELWPSWLFISFSSIFISFKYITLSETSGRTNKCMFPLMWDVKSVYLTEMESRTVAVLGRSRVGNGELLLAGIKFSSVRWISSQDVADEYWRTLFAVLHSVYT